MPVNKPVKKRGPYKKKEILPPAIGEPVSPPAMDEKLTLKIDKFSMLVLQFIGKGDASDGLYKILGEVISLDWKSIERLRDR